MTCPVCKGTDARRSRRQDIPDYILSVMGVYPWRCQECHARFHGRKVSLSDAMRAHCPICGNQDLKRISPELVDTHFAFLWRWLKIAVAAAGLIPLAIGVGLLIDYALRSRTAKAEAN